VHPATLRIGSLVNRETVGVRLDQLEIVPRGPVGEELLAGGVEGLFVGDAHAGELIGVVIARERPAAVGGRYRLGPESAVFTREAGVAIVDLLAHRDGEGHAEAANEVLLVVAVKDDGV